ncbi:D-glycero-alpha-D-manno-heptose-1,7-bisphosphate 7-phosphatase [Paraburkholderia sacchari]|uniref:D-glycero-alpha-D-manno-heptose-1,7-bisphosphate 7-phosphatase n=1 Tax=Paraburkholderia sacchari TaxID=159450 RepID=UPI0005438F4B|nr:HAD family hydrolase [Paraburkholderia sacchari]NLP61663.1 HAD family hydrolase [Paraburkholderia sacchari]
MSRRALFLDRDGVINIDHGYVVRRDAFDFVDGIFELVAQARARGYLVIVVTNQAGIGRGYYTEADFHALMEWVGEQFDARGGHIDKVYFCPDHPEHGVGEYRRVSEFRKPAPGMLLAARDDFDIDMKASLFVGDNLTDMQAGAAAGVGTNLLLTPEGSCDFAETIPSLQAALSFLR